MATAARVGDATTHGGMVAGPGATSVLIGGAPAALLGDNHACPIPAITGHLQSSPFTIGSTTVTIEGKPVLRSGDLCGCGASVVIGDATVIIG